MSHTSDDRRDVAWVFERPTGTAQLRASGQWWMTRNSIGLEPDGTVTLVFADGECCARINGNPATLARVAEAITAHVESAILNGQPAVTSSPPTPNDACTACRWDPEFREQSHYHCPFCNCQVNLVGLGAHRLGCPNSR